MAVPPFLATPSSGNLVLPGQILGPASKYTPGKGTHLYNNQVCTSVSGFLGGKGGVLSVENTALAASSTSIDAHIPQSKIKASPILPTVNSTVLARVTRISPRQATVEILVVGSSSPTSSLTDPDTVPHTWHILPPSTDKWQGLIRVQDIRATEKDRVKVGESFRPGDLVRGVVISLGDQSNYYISTAKNLLGVVAARSEGGREMRPVSWREFVDPVTGGREMRKVAKPF